jgi:3-hydroxyacyl-CoA dehydrogenase/3-hydroxy-2-methylbutyryl-CoA dehydrogenase
MQLSSARALVTGGASGLGEGTVRMIAAAGGKATIIDLASSKGADLAKELGANVTFAPCDVTNTKDVEQAIATAVQAMGGINLNVNCAGISPAQRMVGRDGKLFDLDLFRKTIEINLIGAFDVIRQAAGAMAKNEPGASGERGVIINVSSVAAIEGQKGQAAYTASKGGLLALTLMLARDLADVGVRVNNICPGVMDTPMLAGVDEKRREGIINLNVFPKRLGTPTDFAHLVRFLAENEMMNGEVVRLDAAVRL